MYTLIWTLQKNSEGRGWELSQVRKILDVLVAEGKVFDVKSDTSVDEIIQHFNQKGVYYEATRHSSAHVGCDGTRVGPVVFTSHSWLGLRKCGQNATRHIARAIA